ncbi:uncharacterized protein LOC136088552 isoform X4 [Hydra vulgaris]|uniref:Uncharacterized protein LOC136088552 isoform X4 n=1 Tax=Hydra vulgaris TaxID=6087 RepID=A0ABM4D2N9_HYDVU
MIRSSSDKEKRKKFLKNFSLVTNMLRFNINYTHIIQFLKNIWCSKSVPKKTFATFFKNGEKSDVLPRSKVAAACFNKLENLVLEHNWQIHSIEKWKGELAERHYGVMYMEERLQHFTMRLQSSSYWSNNTLQ